MIYNLYQTQQDALNPVRLMAKTGMRAFGGAWVPHEWSVHTNTLRGVLELIAFSGTTHSRPSYDIATVQIGNRDVPVREEVVMQTPFCDLVHFAKDSDITQPKMLVVAPMSGHFATLLRGTIRTVLPDHDVYITDWRNARDVSMNDGDFAFDDFTDHVIGCLETLGPGAHVLAVCQPTVGVLAAAAVMAEDDNPCQPRSMTLMAGPIDTRLNPTRVNDMAKEKPIEWFEKNLIGTVPWQFKGRTRRVYPGFMQLSAFMSMNIDRHIAAHFKQLRSIIAGDEAAAATHRRFYDEYFAVMDLPANFYIQTVQRVFQEHQLPLGTLQYRGRQVDPGAIRRTFLFTVEGELDDICAIGQTLAAQDLCTNLSPQMKRHHLQTGVGHYGVFNGTRWAKGIYPQVREIIQACE